MHGTAPTIAGEDIANPLAQILSGAMMFEYTFRDTKAAQAIESAVGKVLNDGYRTPDIATEETNKNKIIGTREMGAKVAERLAA